MTLPEAAEFLQQACQHGFYSRVSTADLSARLIQQSFYCRLASTVPTAEFLQQTCQHGSYSRVSRVAVRFLHPTVGLPARLIQHSFYCRLASTVPTVSTVIAPRFLQCSRVATTDFLLVVQYTVYCMGILVVCSILV